MKKILPTYYDELHISPRASSEEIRQAYRRLSQKYHPDKNANHPQSVVLMQRINQAYAVLSDAKKRQQYDENLWQQPQKKSSKLIFLIAIIGGIFILGMVYFFMYTKREGIHLVADQALLRQVGEKVTLTATGEQWPDRAMYVQAYPILNNDGKIVLTIYNDDKQTDIFAQLYSVTQPEKNAIRSFYIPKEKSFTLQNLQEDKYYLRFQLLENSYWQQSYYLEIKEK